MWPLFNYKTSQIAAIISFIQANTWQSPDLLYSIMITVFGFFIVDNGVFPYKNCMPYSLYMGAQGELDFK